MGREAVRPKVGRVALVVPAGPGLAPERSATLLAEGALLGAYRFDRYRTSKDAKGARPRIRIAYTRRTRELSKIRYCYEKALQTERQPHPVKTP